MGRYDITKYLENKGYVKDYEDTDIEQVSNEIYIMRIFWNSNLIQIAHKKTFDRWANSVLYERRIPYTEKEMDKMLIEISQRGENGG
jgi:hypothetical protein